MRVERRIAMAAMAVAFVLGCNQAEDVKPTVSNHNESADNCTPDIDAMSATLARMAAAGVSLTNCLFQTPDKAMNVYRQIHDDILTLSPGEGEQCVKTIVKGVLSVPYERLDRFKRAKALCEMWDIMGDVWWPGMGEVDLWDMRMLRLSRMRDMVKYAQSDTNVWSRRSAISGYSSYLTYDSEHLERILAEWIESPDPPQTRRALSRDGMTEEDCAIVKARFEAFLGRPIRTCDEIGRASIERIKQRDLERKRIAAEQQKLEALILNDRRTGRHDSWYIGGAANTNLPETATGKPSKK